MAEEEQAKVRKTEVKDPVTKATKQKSISNDLEENVDDADMGVSHSINPQLNEVLTLTTGSFRESRRIRGGAKNQEVPFQDALPLDDVEEILSATTGKPNWVTVEEYTPMMFDDEPHDTLAPTYHTQSISTSSGTTVTYSTKKRAPKRKPVLTQPSSSTTANVSKNEVTRFSRVDTLPTELMMAEPPTPLVEDVGPVSMDTDGSSEELVENRPNSKKIKQSHRMKGTVHLPVNCST